MFSIIIPTWNNLDMLKLCIESIRKNSSFEHQIVLHINEGADGTQKWADTEGVAYTLSPTNIGICHAVNIAFDKANKDYIVYLNDDMYVLPEWDKFLVEEIQSIENQSQNTLFMLSATMIEPRETSDLNIIVADYGREVETFEKEKLLAEFRTYKMDNWYGASWPPLLVSRAAWLAIGGFSIEFSPGMYSDPDFSMKLWLIGCRIFKGVGRSRVYHFQARSTGRIKKNNGRLQFMKKWGIPASFFYKNYLKMGQTYAGALEEPQKDTAFKFAEWKARWHSFFKKN
jgi:glycosyltransferase involved in cell wall biosynthesis